MMAEQYREVERKALAGERIKITAPNCAAGKYSRGDVFTVTNPNAYSLGAGVFVDGVSIVIFHREYVVLEPIALKAPPVGLKPRRLHEEERLSDVTAAIGRYLTASKPIPAEWVAEYNELAGAVSA